MKQVWVAAAVALALGGPVFAQQVPQLEGYALNGEAVALPLGLGGKPLLLVLSFGGLNEDVAARWRDTAQRAGTGHLTLLVMGDRGRFARAATSGSLRADAPKSAPWDRIVPVYQEPTTIRAALGLRPTSSVQAVLVDGEGRVLAALDGAPDASAELAMRTALATGPARAVGRVEAPALASAPTPALQLMPAPATTALPAPVVAPTPSLAPLSGAPATRIPEPALTEPSAVLAPTPATAPARAASETPAPSLAPAPSMAAAPVTLELNGITLAGERIAVPGAAKVLVIAASARDVDDLLTQLDRLARDGACTGGCLGLVAMGKNPMPSRAFAAGRLRGEVTDTAMRARIVPDYEDAETLFTRFAPDANGPLAVATLLEGALPN